MYFTAISVISSEVKDKQQPRLIAPYIQFGLSKRIIRPEITTVPCQKSSQIINSLKGKKFSTIWWTFKFLDHLIYIDSGLCTIYKRIDEDMLNEQ